MHNVLKAHWKCPSELLLEYGTYLIPFEKQTRKYKNREKSASKLETVPDGQQSWAKDAGVIPSPEKRFTHTHTHTHTHTAPNGNRQSGFLQMGRLLREDLGCVSAASTGFAASPPGWNSSRWKVRSSKKNPLHRVLWRKPGLDKLFIISRSKIMNIH